MEKDFRSVSEAAAVLGTLFYADPSSAQCSVTLEWLADGQAADSWAFGQPEAGACLRRLALSAAETPADVLHCEYNRLFIGPSRLPAPPWASVYTDPESVLFGNETLALRRWMRDNQVEFNLVGKEPEDHFGLMMLMLAWSVQNGVSQSALEAFLGEHLLPWAPRFLELFESGAELLFYKEAAMLASLTLGDWRRRFEIEPLVLPLAR